MEKLIGFCGNICTECPTFLATKNNDDNERENVAEIWRKKYNPNLTSEDINCQGCLSKKGVLFGYCQTCEIRNCGISKGIENCAYCDEYICDKLTNFYLFEPEGKIILDGINVNINFLS